MFSQLHHLFSSKSFLSLATVSISLASLGFTAKPADAAVLALSDRNSLVAYDPDLFGNPVNNGVILWTVEDVNQLFQNQFWYRIGSEGRENTINTLQLTRVEQSQPTSNQLSVAYTGSDLEISLDFKLLGGVPGSGKSKLFENIKIKNTGSNPLDFHFFNYSDFDLNENGRQDTTIISSNKAKQFDKFTVVTEVVEPVASYYQVSPFSDILDSLNDNAPTTLNNFAGAIKGENTYAFQWNFVLNPEQSFVINNFKFIEPVPESNMTLSLIVFSGLMLMARLRLRFPNSPH